MSGYITGYIEEDYYEGETVAVTQLPDPPLRSDTPAVFIEKANLFMSKLPQLATEVDAVATALNNGATNSVSTTSNTIASTGSKTFMVEAAKGYLIGQTVRFANALDGTIWMQGDVTAYNYVSGQMTVTINISQGSGTFTSWTVSVAATAAGGTGGSLSQDFSVKTLRHAISSSVASASTIDLTSVTGNFAHITGNTTIGAAIMTAGIDVWVVFDSAIQLNYNVTTHQLNSNGVNISAAIGGIALYTYDGVTVRVLYFAPNGKANQETAPPSGMPVGSIMIFAASTAPANYLKCPTTPTNISRSTYSALFAAIGTTWGVGDGSTTFGIPWMTAGYAITQANSNVGASDVGAVIAHTHGGGYQAGGQNTGSANPPAIANIGSQTDSTGGSFNQAAGTRFLICVKYQ